jgi:hypothetical protein
MRLSCGGDFAADAVLGAEVAVEEVVAAVAVVCWALRNLVLHEEHARAHLKELIPTNLLHNRLQGQQRQAHSI